MNGRKFPVLILLLLLSCECLCGWDLRVIIQLRNLPWGINANGRHPYPKVIVKLCPDKPTSCKQFLETKVYENVVACNFMPPMDLDYVGDHAHLEFDIYDTKYSRSKVGKVGVEFHQLLRNVVNGVYINQYYFKTEQDYPEGGVLQLISFNITRPR